MIKGFVFNGKKSWDLGIEAELVSCPLSAEPKNVYLDVPTADGELDLSKVNPRKRLLYKPRIIEFLCHVSFDPNFTDMEEKAAEIAAALCTDGDCVLRIAGASTYTYMGRAANLYNITPESDTSFSFPLVFRCQPYRFAAEPVSAEGADGQIVAQNDGVATDFRMSIEGAPGEELAVRSSAYPARELRIPSEGAGLVIIDTEQMKVTSDGVDVTSSCSGEFFDLVPGENVITVECSDEHAQLSILYTKKYL